MDVKQYICIEVKKGDFTFSFNMPSGSSWGNALDASFDIMQQVQKMSQEAVDKMNPNKGE